jgi:hypothetical protein
MESCAFHLYPTTDVLTFSTSTSSSSLLDFGQSVISSTKTSSFSWDCRGPIFSSGLAKVLIRVRNTILGPRVLPYFSLLHCGGLFLNPFQANGLWAQGGNILQLDHIFKLLHSLLTPLALRSNPERSSQPICQNLVESSFLKFTHFLSLA